MEWSTHALSGVVAGYVVTGDWKGAIVGGIAGVIPDLDEHKSKFGKLFFPVSYPINKLFGHRTVTHSLLFAFLSSAILFPFTEKWAWLATFLGIMSHIIGDMLTGKVKLFYPLDKSIGLSVHPINFKLIDRITRVLLVISLVLIVMNRIP